MEDKKSTYLYVLKLKSYIKTRVTLEINVKSTVCQVNTHSYTDLIISE